MNAVPQNTAKNPEREAQKQMNVTYSQKQVLLKQMKAYPALSRGRVSRKSESRKEMKQIWETIARAINMTGSGPNKTGAEWCKTWNDWKMYALKKETKRISHMSGTGGGPPCNIKLSPLEEDLLRFLTPEAVGLPGIPQGGFTEPSQALEEILVENQVALELPAGDEDTMYMLETQPSVFMDGEDSHTSDHAENQFLDIVEHLNLERPNHQVKARPRTKERRKDTPSNPAPKTPGNAPEKSMSDISRKMLLIQEEKLELKKKELELQRTSVQIMQEMLQELKDLNKSLQPQNTDVDSAFSFQS